MIVLCFIEPSNLAKHGRWAIQAISKRPRSVFKTIVAPIVGAVAIIPTLAIAVWEVLRGRGAAVYTNVYGLPIGYTSVLILVGVMLAVLLIAYIARIVFFWRTGRDGAAKLHKIGSPADSVDPEET